jgi:hypothetical protein
MDPGQPWLNKQHTKPAKLKERYFAHMLTRHQRTQHTNYKSFD